MSKCIHEVKLALQKIKKYQKLNAFAHCYEKEAQEKAILIDQKIQAKSAGKIAGLIVGLKDLISYKNHPLQAASKILENFVAQLNATLVDRLLKEDAIIIGHHNCDEFGMGSSNENSIYGPVHHPLDYERVPGGSSGGSAVAVQTGMCQIAIGTDTGGSVRQPAAFCGIVGFKPTYSRISRYGVVAYASSLDTVGLLAKDVETCAKVFSIIAGKDEFDNTVSQKTVPNFSQGLFFKQKAKIGYVKNIIDHTGIQKEVQENTYQIIELLTQERHQVTPIELKLVNYLLPTYHLLSNAEASSNLARFDGVRYGYRAPNIDNWREMYIQTRSQGFGQEVKKRILLGAFVLNKAYYNAYYIKAQKVRRLIQDEVKKIFLNYDFILLPTAPTTAFLLGSYKQNPMEMYLSDLYTVLASLTGMPALSIPNGVDNKGLPIGLQLIAPYFEEAKLLAFASLVERLLKR